MIDVPIGGTCRPEFKAVSDAFISNFDDTRWGRDTDAGASVCVRIEGETVLDLWGGYRDAACSSPWSEDTIVCVFSVTKAIAAVVIHALYSECLIDIDAPIARDWPAFAQNGKAQITARMVLSQTAGLLNPDVPEGSLWHPGVMTRAIEAMAPEWVPGTECGYHSFSYGPILQEWVLRATGTPLNQHLRHRFTEPFALDFFAGLSDAEIARCADIIDNPDNGTLRPFRTDPGQDVYHHWRALDRSETFNSDAWRRHPFFSLAGHGNARGIAGMLSPLANAGQIDGQQVIAPDQVASAIAEHWSGYDRFGQGPGRFAAGFQMADDTYPFDGTASTVGFHGIGGSLGFADPVRHVSFGYARNALIAGGAGVNPMSQRMIKALYEAI
ncbi:MAG: serine hydrolase domain-containing protein [Pseudomonadota bacterium]